MATDELVEAVRQSRSEIELLKQRLDELQGRTSLVSPSFLTRAFAVLGHHWVAHLIIVLPLYGLIFIFVCIVSILGL